MRLSTEKGAFAMKYVYLVRAGEGEYKVGVASNIVNRVKALQTSNAHAIEVIVAKQTIDAPAVEKSIHQSLHSLKLNGGREWFKMTPEIALNVAITISKSPTISISDVQILRELLEENMLKQQKISGRFKSFINQYNYELEIGEGVTSFKEDIKAMARETIQKDIINAKKKTNDELTQRAIMACADAGKASTSLLQRRLRIGYGRAARLMEDLENQGYITAADGSRPRQYIGAPITAKSILNS